MSTASCGLRGEVLGAMKSSRGEAGLQGGHRLGCLRGVAQMGTRRTGASCQQGTKREMCGSCLLLTVSQAPSS